MEEENYKIPQEIYDLAHELMDLYEIMYRQVQPDVKYILSKQSKNVSFIERTLDNLLEIPTDEAYDSYKAICDYYMTIDASSAQYYMDTYNEIYGIEEEPKTKKKTISDE